MPPLAHAEKHNTPTLELVVGLGAIHHGIENEEEGRRSDEQHIQIILALS
jgi:hypothetical protein